MTPEGPLVLIRLIFVDRSWWDLDARFTNRTDQSFCERLFSESV
jgi:hypothetical protein